MTLEQAKKRIVELEEENTRLKAEIEEYRNRKMSGRKKHNDKWMDAYNSFVVKYEDGLSIVEIAEQNEISRRTAYRYKAYYDKIKNNPE